MPPQTKETSRVPVEEQGRAVRTCVGCGRRAPKDEFLRLVARDGLVVFGPTASGRGAYTCRRLACFERAASKNAFNRTLRETVRLDPELVRLYTDH